MDLDLNPLIIHQFQTQVDLVLEDSRLSNLFTLKTDIIIENINLKGNSSNTGKINLTWIINLTETIKHQQTHHTILDLKDNIELFD